MIVLTFEHRPVFENAEPEKLRAENSDDLRGVLAARVEELELLKEFWDAPEREDGATEDDDVLGERMGDAMDLYCDREDALSLVELLVQASIIRNPQINWE